MKTCLLLGLAALFSTASAPAAPLQATRTLAPYAQIDKPPSPSKLLLIRRFLRAIGRKTNLRPGAFLNGMRFRVAPCGKSQLAKS